MIGGVAMAAFLSSPDAAAQSRPKFQLRSARPAETPAAPIEPAAPLTIVDDAEPLPIDLSRPSDWAPPADAAASLDGGATLNPALLEPIRDNTRGLEFDDRHAYFFALWLCRELGPERIAEFAEAFCAERRLRHPKLVRPDGEFATFADVLQHPDDYRGRPVQWRGRLRRLVKFEPGENDLGVRHVYEGWVYDEHAQHNPAVVIFTRKPAGLPLGDNLDEELRCAGYFLKLYGYEAQDAPRKAPLVIAGEVQWNEPPAIVATTAATPWHYIVTTILAGVVIGGVWLGSRASPQRRAWPAVLPLSRLPAFCNRPSHDL
jgi:hypothetical protein